MPLDTITRMCPSAPALARSDMTGLGVVTSCRVPVRVALSAPVAWISTSALNDLICWVCCAASDSAEDDDIPLWEPEPLEELVYTPGLHPATVMAATAATAAKPSGRTARAGPPKRAGRAGRSWVVPGWGAPDRRAFNCENTLGPPWVGDCATCQAIRAIPRHPSWTLRWLLTVHLACADRVRGS